MTAPPPGRPAPRRLVVVRHAKAGDSAPSDADRPLTARGSDDAAAAGRRLADAGLVPDAVVVSPALRARQTWEGAAVALPGAPPPVVDPRLYDNTLDDYLAVVREAAALGSGGAGSGGAGSGEAGSGEVGGAGEGPATLVLVGHNPSVAALLAELADPEAGRPLPESVPPGSVAVLDVAGAWADLGTGGAVLADAWAPLHG